MLSNPSRYDPPAFVVPPVVPPDDTTAGEEWDPDTVTEEWGARRRRPSGTAILLAVFTGVLVTAAVGAGLLWLWADGLPMLAASFAHWMASVSRTPWAWLPLYFIVAGVTYLGCRYGRRMPPVIAGLIAVLFPLLLAWVGVVMIARSMSHAFDRR